MRKRSKVILGVSGVAVTAALLASLARKEETCPVTLPPNYNLENYLASESSARLAQRMQFRPSNPTSTRAYWNYRSKGSVARAKPDLLAHLQKQGRWKTEMSRPGFAVFTDDKGNQVMMYSFSEHGESRHFVRVSGPTQSGGPYEKFLALLPAGALERLAKGRLPEEPIQGH